MLTLCIGTSHTFNSNVYESAASLKTFWILRIHLKGKIIKNQNYILNLT